jgi:hypothetical protein
MMMSVIGAASAASLNRVATATILGGGLGASVGGLARFAALSLNRFQAQGETTGQTARNLTPVQQGELARSHDAAAAEAPATPPASEAGLPLRGIRVGSTVNERPDGTTLTTVYINVRANFVVDGGTLPSGVSAANQARTIERTVERDYNKSYTEKDGDTVRYVTSVQMTVATAVDPTRTNFVYVAATDSRINGALGRAPDFEKGNIAYVSDAAPPRTAPHEFGHLAGLRHVASSYENCVVPKGTSAENLMSQTFCAPKSHQIERSQLRQIFQTPEFRPVM